MGRTCSMSRNASGGNGANMGCWRSSCHGRAARTYIMTGVK